MTSYKLNTTAAKSAETSNTTTRIDQTGAYKGKFTLAKKIVANSGTEGIEFTFQADDGKVANWLRLYTIKADGTETFGYGMLMAAMDVVRDNNAVRQSSIVAAPAGALQLAGN